MNFWSLVINMLFLLTNPTSFDKKKKALILLVKLQILRIDISMECTFKSKED